MDWRSTTPRQVQDDLDNLLRDSVVIAGELLGAAGEFAPFMLVVDSIGGKAVRRAELAGTDESALRNSLTLDGDRGRLRARATVFDVAAREPFTGTAIKVTAEHAEGIAIDLLVPYALDQDAVRIDMDGANAAVAPPRLWS